MASMERPTATLNVLPPAHPTLASPLLVTRHPVPMVEDAEDQSND